MSLLSQLYQESWTFLNANQNVSFLIMHCFAVFSTLVVIFINMISCLPSDFPDNLGSKSSEISIANDFNSIWADDQRVDRTSNVPEPEDTLTLTSDPGEEYTTDTDDSTLDSNIIVTADENAPLEQHCGEVNTNGILRIRETGACSQQQTRRRKKKAQVIEEDLGESNPFPKPSVPKKVDEKNRRCKGNEPFVINVCCTGDLTETMTWQGLNWYALVENCEPYGYSKSRHTTINSHLNLTASCSWKMS